MENYGNHSICVGKSTVSRQSASRGQHCEKIGNLEQEEILENEKIGKNA